MITVTDIRKTFGKTAAVKGVSFEVPNGSITALLGPNGAGKTTTIRSITGLVRPDAGRVDVDGIDVAAQPIAARARLGVVPEQIGVYDHLTVREHLEYSADLQGVAGATRSARIERLLEQLGLVPLASRLAGSLSLGERRRLALARALVHEPANLVFDEPTNGLDVMSAREVRREITRLASSGCAILVSTHVMPEVAALCNRVVVMAAGTVIATGTPGELLRQTRRATLEDAFVQMIGSEEGLN
jgi:sodium transport system ATP-binding protein